MSKRCFSAWVSALAGGVFFVSVAASAQSIACGQTYIVESGDTLSGIASRTYTDGRKWSVIYNANIGKIGTNPHLIRIGMQFRIPCLETSDGPDAVSWVSADDKAIKGLTADDYRPFTNRKDTAGGMVTEIVDAAMAQAPGVESYGVAWVNDWSAHLDPLLSSGAFDLGFPWLRPNCEGNPGSYRCSKFLFSEPMFEMLVLLFADGREPFGFAQDSDIVGKTLCRPAGYYTHDLEKDGRNWLSENKITLKQPDSVDACFDLLVNGQVDAVALNEFTGRSAVHRLGLSDRVEIIQTRPLSIEGLHVLVHRNHPEADRLIEAIDTGLERIKADGRYQAIVDRHLAQFWDKI
jgi:polar amino acid transport system substrate-binding protein